MHTLCRRLAIFIFKLIILREVFSIFSVPFCSCMFEPGYFISFVFIGSSIAKFAFSSFKEVIFSMKYSTYRCLSVFIVSSNFEFMVHLKVTPNGLGICEGTAFENRQPSICTKVDSSTNVQLLPSAVLCKYHVSGSLFFFCHLHIPKCRLVGSLRLYK